MARRSSSSRSLLSLKSLRDYSDWQTTKDTVQERNTFMFNNALMSDVRFVVGEAENVKKIPAHKYVLSISSPVFYTMFYGEMADTSSTIEIPDCDGECFLEFLRFLYTDEAMLSADNVMGIFYLGKKYIVPSLVRLCVRFLEDSLTEENVCTILNQSLSYGEKELEKTCWDLIEQKGSDVVQTDDFLNISHEALRVMLEKDNLNVRESVLFRGVNRWATEQCTQQSLSSSGENKRRVLADAIFLIRFPLMSQVEFAQDVVPTQILNSQEVVSIFMTFSSANTSAAVEFSKKPREFIHKLYRCCRFQSASSGWTYVSSGNIAKVDGVGFSIDIPIMICGVRLFGQLNSSYKVFLELRDDANKCIVSSGPKSYVSSAGGRTGHIGFDVVFDTPVSLTAQSTYYICANMTGGASLKGQKGYGVLKCNGVQFKFFNYPGSNNGTDTSTGQVPEILFYREFHGRTPENVGSGSIETEF